MTGHHTGWRIAGLCAGWLAGIGVQLQEPALKPLAVYQLAVLGGVLWMLAGWRWRRLWPLAVLGAALAGFGGAGWHATLSLRDALPSSLEGQDIEPRVGEPGRERLEAGVLGAAEAVRHHHDRRLAAVCGRVPPSRTRVLARVEEQRLTIHVLSTSRAATA